MSLASPPSRPVHYPTGDGKPMAETDKHRDGMVYVINALKTFFAGREDVYVSGNNFLYFEPGNPKKFVSPDGYVVFGVSPEKRDAFFVWEEGGARPAVVFEFTSKWSRREDTDKKLPLYERTLEVPEYFLFDPTSDYLFPPLQGYRLIGGQYQRIPTQERERLYSQQLGLFLEPFDDEIRFLNPLTGKYLPDNLEQAEIIEEQVELIEERDETIQQQADTIGQQADTIEQQASAIAVRDDAIEQLRAEIARLRGETGE